jgi:translation initiation factor IF-2
MAASTKAIVIGFNTKIGSTAQKLAEIEHVLIRSYNIIYELIDELQDVVDGMLKIDQLEETLGTAQILAEFPYGKDQKIAGCRILEGYFTKGPKVRIMRGEEVVVETKIKSLKKVREEVNRMDKGGECGMMFEENIDFAVGDLVVSYRVL